MSRLPVQRSKSDRADEFVRMADDEAVWRGSGGGGGGGGGEDQRAVLAVQAVGRDNSAGGTSGDGHVPMADVIDDGSGAAGRASVGDTQQAKVDDASDADKLGGEQGGGRGIVVVAVPHGSAARDAANRDEQCFRFTDLFVMWLLGGWFGLHHFALGRWFHGVCYLLTFGLFGLGYVYDGCRLHRLRPYRFSEDGRGDISLSESYVWLVGTGIIGLHWLYLGGKRNNARFLLCLCTLNFLCIGYVVDYFRLPAAYRSAVRDRELARGGLREELSAA